MLDGVQLRALPGIPEIQPGDDLAAIIRQSLTDHNQPLADNSVLVVAQKIVSKAEGRLVQLCDVSPSARALELSEITKKDSRLVELILSESTAILRAVPSVMIVRHRLGYIMANAGIDQSNLPGNVDGEQALLLPIDPHQSAHNLRLALTTQSGAHPGVIISDSFGRPWRNGVVNVALACSGIPALIDQSSQPDRHGRILQHTVIAYADAIAAGAALVMGESAEGTPVAIVTGLHSTAPINDANAIIRPLESDLFQ